MPRLEVRDLVVHYEVPGAPVQALDRVTLSVSSGEIVGLVGESGSGKTSVVLAALRLLPQPGRVVAGTVVLDGVDLAGLTPAAMRRHRGKAIGYVPQAAMNSLNPLCTVGAQIAESLTLHTDLDRAAVRERVRAVLDMVELPADVARRFPHELSGGMRQRAVIAMALAPRPGVVLADEPTSGLDVLAQVQVLSLLRRLVAELGLALLVVSHDLRLVARWCDRAVLLYAGRVVEEGPADALLGGSLHPYAAALADSLPKLRGPVRTVSGIAGEPADLTHPPAGCRFHPRCAHAFARCSATEPVLLTIGARRVACHLHDE